MTPSEELIEKARRCRRLAAGIPVDAAHGELLRMANELEERASELERAAEAASFESKGLG
jgi:hypothetical protein